MINKFTYIYLGLLLLISCSDNQKNSLINDSNIEINSNGDFKNNIFDIITIPELLTFKETEDYPIRYIKNGLSYNQTYYLCPNKYDGELYIADNKGVFKNIIQDKGNDPFQYRELTSFAIDEKRQELYIHDFQKQRFSIYDLNGNFKKVIPIAYNFLWFSFLDDYLYLFTSKHENFINENALNYDILVLDRDFNIVNKYFPFDARKFSSIRLHKDNPFYFSNNNTLFFNDLFSDAVYAIKDGRLNKQYAFNYLNNTFSEEFKDKPHSEIIEELTNNKEAYFDLDIIGNIYNINSSYVVTQFTHNGIAHHNFKSLKTKNSYNYIFPDIYKSDINYHTIFKPLFNEKNNFVSMVYPFVLKFLKEQYIEKYKKEDKFTKKVDLILENTIEDGNQIIVKYKIKDF